ncbi:MAG: phage portal protein [Planctomycetes bacterium]|nr:phage portal protein [Planctomycetota bacterium]
MPTSRTPSAVAPSRAPWPREQTAPAPAPVLAEAWGDLVDRHEFLNDSPGFGPSTCRPLATTADRQQGRFSPVYECEQDLALIRGRARHIATLTPTYTGVLEALANYVIGPGLTFTVHPLAPATASPLPTGRPPVAEDSPSTDAAPLIPAGRDTPSRIAHLATAVQQVLDEFLDDNDFYGALDREAHNRSREEGEAFLLLTPQPRGRVRARFLECEQITEPADPRPLEDWLGCAAQFPSCWTFGVHTVAGETQRPLGYHVVRDASGHDWDYIPAGRLEHFKRNVPANAKRGVSDFLPVLGELEREAKLRRNTAHSAALQAAIAWILETPPGTYPLATQVGAGDVPMSRYTRSATGGRDTELQYYPPGTILRPSAGLQYKPGPMGSERNPNFLLVGQYLLRAIAVRWNMPEYLISADSSHANYASSLVAESPFVKAREADQQFYKRHFRSLAWKVVHLAWQAGRFARHGVTWETLRSLLDMQLDAPAVATRDMLQLAQTQELQMRLGILSPRTAATQAGLDYDAERRAAGTAPT